jgi:membrane-bound serine protease (ClpP class)
MDADMSVLEWFAAGLFVIALLLFIVELFVPSGGILAIAGAIALAVVGILIVAPGLSALTGADWLIFAVAGTILLLVVVAAGNALRLRHMAPLTGVEAMIGRTGEARSDLDPRGFVFVNGEYWSAESDEGSVQEGDAVIITAVNGLNLKVRKANSKGATG